MLRRAVLAVVLGAIAVLVAVATARGAEQFYLVTGLGDGPGSCAPYPNVPGGFTCTTLRGAVAAADANPGTDEIVLQNLGTYQLTQGAIELKSDVVVAGQDARQTIIDGGGTDRVFVVDPGVTATLYGMTLDNGAAPNAGDGGALLNSGTLELMFMRVTNSTAVNGGGIGNSGDLTVFASLIDGNNATDGAGGGIVNHGPLHVQDTTIFANHAASTGGIDSDATEEATLLHDTIAGNRSFSNPAGVSFLSQWQSIGSLFVSNDGDSVRANCGGALDPSSTGNMEDGTGCGFDQAASGRTDIGLDTALSYQGGHTSVLTIPATSPAKRFVNPCADGVDQRDAPRNATGACDAGAYEQGATAPPLSAVPFPTPTPSPTPPPTPTPTATPTPTPTPVAYKSVVAQPVKGSVRIKLPGTNRFIDLSEAQGIPVGATVDTRHGTVRLTALQKPGGKPQTASFFDGLFKLTQTKTTTDLTLNEPLARCPKKRHARAAAAARKPKTRRLWGSGHGSFRTKGQYSAATVRGTKWLVQDSCAGTLTKVTQGVVSVRDNVRHKTIILRAGRHYLAKPRR